jgi:tetratricopeptide (TPR) repeat protein
MEREFQAAMAAQDRGDLDQAESMLVALRSKHPGLFAVDESLGLLYVAREQFATALPILEAAAKENPSSGVAHANLGADYLKLGKNEDAVHELRIAVRLNPNEGETQSNLGQALVSNGQRVEAAKAFGKAVALEPENGDLRYDWAAVLLDAGDTNQAAEVLAPVRNQETMPQVQALLGEIAEKQGRFLDAVGHLQAAAKLDPSEANLYLLGMEYLKHWTFQPALQFFEYGIARYPSSQRMLLGLGITRYSMNQLPVAAPIFAQLLDTDPQNTTYADLLGRSCTLMPDTIKECEKLERFAEANPQHAAIDTYAATSILARSNETPNLDLAAKLLDEAIQVDPKLAEAHLQKGFLLQYREQWRESISELETSVALRPESSRAHYRLALAYTHTGNREKAREQIILQKKYREREKDGIDARLNEVQMFLVNTP